MWICFILIWIMSSNSYAANPYKMGSLDYFDRKIGASKAETKQEFDFRDPTIGADGKVAYYMPPSAMLTLLEAPTPENARAYLLWQRQKVARIIKAQQAVDRVMKEQEPR